MAGARVGLLEARMGSELADLVRRHGGVPLVAPAVRETRRACGAEVRELLTALAGGKIRVVLFLTGAGASALFAEAERAGCLAELLVQLQSTVNVCRGQKPWRPLKQHGVPISLTVAKPYTTAEVLEALRPMELGGAGVVVLHYGERNGEIAEALARWGARVIELELYRWELPVNTAPLEGFVRAVIAGKLEAVAFTSQVQARHLFEVAGKVGAGEVLRDALNGRTVVAAVGPTCASALRALGVPPRVEPASPKMGPMVVALAEELARQALGSRRPGAPCSPADSRVEANFRNEPRPAGRY